VVAPGFLENLEVRQWLNGVEPCWTLLEYDSYRALHGEPSVRNQAIRLEPNLTQTDLAGSAVTRNALLVFRAADRGGLALTATGNLSRAVVAEMCEIIEWPDYDKDELFRYHKVINEPDFLPLHFVRVVAQATKLFRAQHGKLIPTRLGTSMLVEKRHGALQALLFHIAFWHMNFGCFDRNPLDPWPQSDVGVSSLVAFRLGERLAGSRDTHASLHGSGHWGAGVCMGFGVQRDGGPHPTTADVVRAA
jgi:hypothetical protein